MPTSDPKPNWLVLVALLAPSLAVMVLAWQKTPMACPGSRLRKFQVQAVRLRSRLISPYPITLAPSIVTPMATSGATGGGGRVR